MSFDDDDDDDHHDNKREKIMINTIEKFFYSPFKNLQPVIFMSLCLYVNALNRERANDMTVCTGIIKWMNYNELYDFLYIFFFCHFQVKLKTFFF